MVKTRTKVVETTGSQVVITEADKEMTVLTIINNLRKICACLFITNNLQENHVAERQNDREKSRNNIDGQQNHRNNDRDDQSDMWSCPLHLIITIGDSGNDNCTVCNCPLHLIIFIGDTKNDRSSIYNRPLHLIIYIGDGEGNIEDTEEEQRKACRNGDDRWEMALGQRRSTEGYRLNREQRRRGTEECSHKKEWRPEGRHSTIKS